MIAKHKGEIPVVILLLPFIVGIVAGLYCQRANLSLLYIAATILTIAFVILNLGYSKLSVYKMRWLGGLFLYPILFLTGWLLTLQHRELNKADHFSKIPARYMSIHINTEPTVKGDVVRFTADVVQAINRNSIRSCSGTLLVTIKDERATHLSYGEELLIPAKFTEIEPPYNPGEFNYKRYLANKNVYHQVYLYPRQYKILRAGQGNPVIAFALQTRRTLVEKLKANMHDTTAIAVASTLILGYKADLSNDVIQAYSKTGTIHILSVSGGHVAIIYALLALVLGFLDGYRRGKLIKVFCIIVLIWAYALLTGFSPAVNRAALMISLVICGKTFARYINSLNILAASAFVLLLYDPFLLTDVGFQLSYLAVAGLVIIQPVVYEWLVFKHKVANYLWSACSVSIAAQVITFPLSAFYFHQVPVYFLLSNLLIILPVMLIMYSGLLLLLLPQLPWVSGILGYVLEHSILVMNKALAWIEQVPFASIGKIWLNGPEHLLLYLLIVAAFCFFYKGNKIYLKLGVVTMLVFCISISLKKYNADRINAISFLDLRKHMGIIFKNGSSGVVLTDLAYTHKTFQYAIQPGLDSMQIAHYTLLKPDSNIRLPYFIKQQNLVQFNNTRLLLLNQSWQLPSIPRQLNVQYLYLSGNALINKKAINGLVVIADGSNSDIYIDKLKNIAVNCKILKRNKSIIIASK
ncbi:ComEC/Rec2 family competence protein [Mucilaginibacter psychrotolerans]|uniref:ComEC family competence protein n=1 Tax=Mucilaginibacter psychrotolerans TaxID=1524096 RepID=A0A4Y8S7F2_9SPHI|nr:ComEC/Rec2 family competence protein [Mucilaginibacter psychrotolerans]TFF34676.1 ComEC family competence protein [Mucilaginibacter psychrotolerans]